MKIKKQLFLIPILVGSLANASQNAEVLVQQKCASCHILDMPIPEVLPTLTAPAMEAVLFHVKLAFKDTADVKKHIIDFAENPNLSKSVCESNKVAKFGLMPSLKGKVSAEELDIIADYLIKSYPTDKFSRTIKEMLKNDKLTALKSSPFLMNQDALPHLTKILLENWTKGTLNLSDGQKEKLLRVRQDTLVGVKKIKKILADLELEIIEMVVDNQEASKIEPKLKEIATLKIQASMIQFKCLQDSIKILNDKQLELLLPFWEL